MIKSFMSWNGYPISIRNFLIRKLKTKYKNYSTATSHADSQTDENIAKIWIKIPYLGNRGENMHNKILHIENSKIFDKAGQIHNYL